MRSSPPDRTHPEAAARRQQAVAELGQRALHGTDLGDLLDEAVAVVASTLAVELAEVQELLPDGESLVLRAAVGWRDGLVGHGTLGGSTRVQAGYTLLSREPVVVADTRAETRFDASGLREDYGVASSMSVVVSGGERSYGVLAAHATAPRDFAPEDVHFLQALANVLAGAIRRAEHERELAESEERLRLALEAGDMGIWDWNLRTDELVWSEKLAEINSVRDGSFDGTFDSFLAVISPEDRERVSAAITAAHAEGAVYDVEFRVRTADGGVRWNASRGRVLRDGEGRPARMIGVAADITDRKENEEELRRSRELYRLVVENAKDLVALLELDGRMAYASPSWEDALGFAREQLAAERNPLEVHPDDLAVVRSALASAVTTGTAAAARARIRAKDGRWIAVEGTVVPIHDEDGRPVLLLTTCRDVTGDREAEEALRTAERRYRSLVEQLPLVTYMDALDGPGSNIYTSPQIEPLLGYSAEEWANNLELFTTSLHPEDRERVLAEHARTHATGVPLRTEYRLLARDGRTVWLQDEAVVVKDAAGRPLFLQGYLLDITERKRAEQALAERESFLKTIIDTEPECVKLVAPDGTLLEMNRAGLEMIEADALEQVAGMEVEQLVAPEDRDAFTALTRRVLGGGSGSLEFELVGLRGTRRRMETHAVPLVGANGEIRAALSVTRDVTERRRLEEQLFRSQKLEAVGRLAGGVAHDFNNLLTGILGYADLLHMSLAEDDPRRADAAEVKRAAERAATLTRQLLAFSRRQVLTPRVIDLNRVVEDMERMLRRLIGEDVELVTAVDPGLGRVEADPGQVEQVIANLVVNARDAMPEGGRLVLQTENADVDATFTAGSVHMPPGPYVVLSVADTGIGMDAETQAHAFEPFFTTKEVGKGTGLGLATVYGIVKQSGGYIWVYSEPGEGTTFKIYLPRVEKQSDDLPGSGLGPSGGGSETVLVVEDEGVVRELIARDLAARGYTVLTAATGVEALAVADGHLGSIELVVTDVVMPGMGGPELMRQLAVTRPETKAVYMSGYTERAVADELGPCPLLQKPFKASTLAGTIREMLDVAAAA